MRLPACLLLTSLILTGCNQPSEPEAAAPAPVVATAESAASDSVEAPAPVVNTDTSVAGVSFTISQTLGDCNPETPYRAKLFWNISDPAKAEVGIYAESPTGPVMATHDAQVFDAETADWVWAGMKFFLVHRPTGEIMATLTAPAETCN